MQVPNPKGNQKLTEPFTVKLALTITTQAESVKPDRKPQAAIDAPVSLLTLGLHPSVKSEHQMVATRKVEDDIPTLLESQDIPMKDPNA